MSSAVRSSIPYVVAIAVGAVIPMAVPTLFPIAAAFTAGVAALGSIRMRPGDVGGAIRSVLLAVGAFGYPLFLGGRALPWAAMTIHIALVEAGWCAVQRRERIAVAQALAAALSVSLSASATQYFFPVAWRWVALAAVAMFLALLSATVSRSWSGWSPVPAVAAAVLVLSEGLVVLRYLPTHWVTNGAALALAFAALLEHRRVPRAAFATLMLAVLLIGTVPT